MSSEDLPLYGSWDLGQFRLPRRSRLYALDPIGLGTPNVESLLSYVSRLAAAHQVKLEQLIQYEIAPWFLPRHSASRLSRATVQKDTWRLWQTHAKVLQTAPVTDWVGGGVRVKQLVKAMENLTLRQDLRTLTLLPLGQVFSLRHTFHTEPFWCPMCYETWREAGVSHSEPLLWSVEGINVCLRHRCYLQLRCLRCHSLQPYLRLQSQIGFCTSCGAWLGRCVDGASFHPKDAQQERWLFWCAEAIGQLLAAQPSLYSPNPTQRSRKRSLITFLKQCYRHDLSCLEGLHRLNGAGRGIEAFPVDFESIR
jgi:hypothetical protein